MYESGDSHTIEAPIVERSFVDRLQMTRMSMSDRMKMVRFVHGNQSIEMRAYNACHPTKTTVRRMPRGNGPHAAPLTYRSQARARVKVARPVRGKLPRLTARRTNTCTEIEHS